MEKKIKAIYPTFSRWIRGGAGKLTALVLALLLVFIPLVVLTLFTTPPKAYAATSPALGAAADFSILGGAAVTCTGATTITGAVGVSPGTSITGFPSPCTATGGTQSNNASAIAAQAATVTIFSALDQACDQTFAAVDLTTTFPSGVGPGVYCSTSSFSLSGNLNLTGSGVHIFKTVSTLITSSGSSITGGDACNVWWRIGSAATLGSTTSFRGNIVTANVADTTAMNSGATLNGRILAQAAATVTLNANTITGPTCAGGSSSISSSSSSVCPTLSPQIIAPSIIESRRIDADSIFISWGPYSGINTFIVQYGLENGNWIYSTNVTGFSTTLNALPLNQPIFVRVAARNNCEIGKFGEAMLVGGPKLPSTGMGQSEKNVPWSFLTGIFLISSFFYLTQRLHKFSQRH